MKGIRTWSRLILFLVMGTGHGLDASSQRVLVSSSNPNQLLIYNLDVEAGKLKLSDSISTSGPPGAFCFNEAGDRLYVSIRKPGGIAAYDVGHDFELSLLGEVTTGAYAGYVRVNSSGNFLFGSYFSAGQVTVHRIHDDGTLSTDPIQKIKTDANAHAVVPDPAGRFLFVPHTRPNKIFQFRMDSSIGKLTPNEPPLLIREVKSGPRHLWFHPILPRAYGSNEQGNSISTYALDPHHGTLSLIETLPSIQPEFAESNSTSDIEVHPSGKFVYIANRGHNSIASFSIDTSDGTLTFLEHTSVEPVPRSFNITPNGGFLIAAGQRSGKLGVYRIEESGKLSHTQTLKAEGGPWWVVSAPTQQ